MTQLPNSVPVLVFSAQVRIPDDRSTRSQFAVIDDELELQLRDILEEERSQEAKAKESIVFRQAR